MKRRKKYRKAKSRSRMYRRSRNPRPNKRIKRRLESLRRELRAERISYGELHELQSLANYIHPEDVELLEAAGVPEFGSGRKKQARMYWGSRKRKSNPGGLKCRSCGKGITLLNAVKSGGTLHCRACVKKYKLRPQKMW